MCVYVRDAADKLLAKAKEREIEQEVAYERKLLREQAADESAYGDKEKFVTSAYKAKLAETQRWKVRGRECDSALRCVARPQRSRVLCLLCACVRVHVCMHV